MNALVISDYVEMIHIVYIILGILFSLVVVVGIITCACRWCIIALIFHRRVIFPDWCNDMC